MRSQRKEKHQEEEDVHQGSHAGVGPGGVTETVVGECMRRPLQIALFCAQINLSSHTNFKFPSK